MALLADGWYIAPFYKHFTPDGVAALRQEGHVYRRQRGTEPPSVRKLMCIFVSIELGEG
jgi:hypothetical protein